MTSLAFILGVVPLAIATGAGRGNAPIAGNSRVLRELGVTLFGLLFTPTFYAVVQSLSRRLPRVGRHTAGSRVAKSISEGMGEKR